jgi:hypothetical protein
MSGHLPIKLGLPVLLRLAHPFALYAELRLGALPCWRRKLAQLQERLEVIDLLLGHLDLEGYRRKRSVLWKRHCLTIILVVN